MATGGRRTIPRQPARAAEPLATPRSRPIASRRASIFRSVLLYLAACWGIIGALLAPVLPGGWLTVTIAALLSYVPLAVFLRGRARGSYPGALARTLLFRGFLYAQLSLPLLAAGGLIGVIVGLPFGASSAAGRAALAAVAAAVMVIATAGWAGSRRLRLRRLRAEWPDLPVGFDGMRIVQISDLHVGPQTSRVFLARVLRSVEREHADLVAITGDLIDDHAPDVEHFAAAFRTLAAPLGVYAVAGNHDVYADWPAVAVRLAALPFTVLVNDALIVQRGGDRLAVVGVGDPAGQQSAVGPDPARALARVPPGVFSIALAHNPALWPALAERGVRLTLSGHTHWGQFALPRRNWSLATPFLRDLVMGEHQRGSSLLYINPGTGFWGLPFRLGAWPEITVITLARGAEPRFTGELANPASEAGRGQWAAAAAAATETPAAAAAAAAARPSSSARTAS